MLPDVGGPTSGRPTGPSAAPGGDVLLDPQRIAAVRRLLAAGVRSVALDEIVQLVSRLLDAPSAQLSLLAEDEVLAAVVPGALPEPNRSPAQDSLCSVTVRRGEALVVPDTAAEPAVAALPPVVNGDVGSYLGVPVVVSGATVGALCAYGPEPREWTEEQVALLRWLARSAAAELALRSLSADLANNAARLDVALGGADIGSFDLDAESGLMLWDRRLIELFGYDPETFVPHLDSFSDRVHPQDRERMGAAVQAGLAGEGDINEEYRIVLPDGRERWVTARGRLVTGDRGERRLVGAAFDSSAIRTERDRFARLLETMTDAFFSLDRSFAFRYVNAQAEALLGQTRGELVGRNVWEAFPAAVGTDFQAKYEHAMASGEMVSLQEYYPAPLDRWFEVRAWPDAEGLSVFFHDITARRRVEADREQARARVSLLADLTTALTSTLEVDEAMQRLADLLVPQQATWVSVTLLDGGGPLRQSAGRHHDPERRADMQRFAQLQMIVATERSLSRTVARTGRPVLRTVDAPSDLSAGWEGEELTGLLERLGMAGVMVVPLQARARILGVLLLAADGDHAPFTEDDLLFAVEVGRRAGLAIDNAQLYDRQRSAAELLQRHLLPALPEPDHLEVRAAYHPAAEEAQVGGDFYWGTVQPGGATVVAIGDVSGHDLAAIAWQAQLAPLLRGFAFEGDDSPAEVLARVDRAMRVLQIDTMATAVLARIEQDPADRSALPGGRRRLRWSNAGHPPPMLLRTDGTVDVLEVDPDLLLGLEPGIERHDHAVAMFPGDTLFLYTDGLVERRDSSLEAGLRRLRSTLEELAGVPLEELCERVVARMVPKRQDDDVALLALRTHREDRPRPAEAGPVVLPPGVD